MSEAVPDACPPEVADYAGQVVAAVERALGVKLSYDSETLSVLDHYLRQVPTGEPATLALVALTAGAYFGEVVRHHLGGRWDVAAGDPAHWRFILPTGLSFQPASLALAAMLRAEGEAEDDGTDIDLPALLRPLLEDTLAGMAEVSEETYYSLCGRLDTLEHLHEVVAALAANKMAEREAAEPAEPDN